MKVLTFSTVFPKKHPNAGTPTYFVEKVMACLADTSDWQMKKDFVLYDWHEYYNCTMPKGHTIRVGDRWKAGDWASLRVWSGAPYRSKQVEFARVEIKKVWPVRLNPFDMVDFYTGENILPFCEVAKNDGLSCDDFVEWFAIHPKKDGAHFTGQIICWSNKIDYTGKPDLKPIKAV